MVVLRTILLKKVFCESVWIIFYWLVSMHVACLVGVHPILTFIFLKYITGVRFRKKELGNFVQYGKRLKIICS